jgi:RNA polymerase sigma-70 factor (ECF subfamily)
MGAHMGQRDVRPFDTASPPGSARDSLPAGPAEERALVARIRLGDAAAFEALFRQFARPLYAAAYRYVGSAMVAEDVVSDLFAKLWENRATWEVPGPLETYLYRAVRNRVLNVIRNTRAERSFEDRVGREIAIGAGEATAPRADAMLDARELTEAIDWAVARLPGRCREVFLLNRYQHLTYAQVASVLQISVKTVEIHMGRALAVLRRRLAPWMMPPTEPGQKVD